MAAEFSSGAHGEAATGGWSSWRAAVLIAVAAFAAYANSFSVPFLFDDVSSIVDNPTIRRLWPPGGALSPPSGWGLTVSGRPILNFSLAVNFAFSGTDPWSYHALNLIIHVAAGWVLLGVVGRTLRRPILSATFSGKADPLAVVIATIWVLHPLQTESVTYVVQRAESLMGLFFLLTLYAFIRAVDSPRPGRWWLVMAVAALLGAGTKEVAALAPLLVLLYDRTFVSGSFAGAWRRHRVPYLLLAATWLPLAWLLAGTGGNRGDTVGFDVGVPWVSFWLTQFEAVTRYLWLSIWPHPLVFDYGRITAGGWSALWPWAPPVLALVAGTIIALKRWPVAGFLGAWFLGILAPTSLVPGAIQVIVEHRMYLPLAAVLAFVVGSAALRLRVGALVAVGTILAVAAGVVTFQRNNLYRNEEALWLDTLSKRPDNARAHNNLGRVYHQAGRYDEAVGCYLEAVRLDPQSAHAHFNLGLALFRLGREEEALPAFAEAVRILPHYHLAHLNRGLAFRNLGLLEEAIAALEAAVRHPPPSPEAHFHLGVALAQAGRDTEAVEQYARAVALNPAYVEALSNWGGLLLRLGAVPEAIERYRQALLVEPDAASVHFNLGLAESARGRLAEASVHYRAAARLDPDRVEARLNLGIVLGQSGDLAGAIAELTEATRIGHENPDTHANLATALLQAGRNEEALAAYRAALRLKPDDPVAHYNAGYVLLVMQQWAEARRHFEQALQLRPDFAPAREMLQRMQAGPPH